METMIDLRSDTVTHPTLEMRKAIATAEVGDDVRGEDPTVNQLQELAADMVGKDASIFIPSGTMGNLLAVLTHCGRGDEIIVGNLSHIFLNEAGGISALGGVHPYPIPNQLDGTLVLNEIIKAIRTNDNPHHPNTKLIALENTHNVCGGRVLTPEYIDHVAELSHTHNVMIHMDGARIFNAAIALCTDVKNFTRNVDSIQFCLSKGLCAPVGSMLCGSKEFIHKAIRIRKQLGGGMRQAGILAAAGIVALTKMVNRLSEDHKRARLLASGLSHIPGLIIDLKSVETNIINLHINQEVKITAIELGKSLVMEGINVDVRGSNEIRLVTHFGIDDNAIKSAISAFSKIIQNST